MGQIMLRISFRRLITGTQIWCIYTNSTEKNIALIASELIMMVVSFHFCGEFGEVIGGQ